MVFEKQKKTIWLINPLKAYRFNWDLKEVADMMGKKTAGHPLALPLLAALTPESYIVRIIDEELEKIPFDQRPDLVGITSLISNIKRGYELADRFRLMGIPVVMGGPQVTFNIEEALTHADCVVAGEAETVWKLLLNDYELGSLKKVYRAEAPFEFETSPVPKWDLLDTSKILAFSVQVSRGCPHQCDFCLVRKLFGRSHRYRDLDNVIEEIMALPADAQISFADDNLTADKQYAKELMRRLIPLRRSWSCQAGFDVTRDEELLSLMAEAGCGAILIGFESLNPESLKDANKPHNKVSEYIRGVENVHKAGIHILASFVAGFDSDTIDTFEQIRKFTEDANLSFVMINALSVYPGTDLYLRMKKEGRVMRINTDLCNGIYPTMQYRNISQAEMFTGILDTLSKIFSFENLAVRGPAVLGNGAFAGTSALSISTMTKLRSMLHVIFRYVLSFDRFKRKLLLRLFTLVRKRRLSVSAMMQYLLFITSIRGYLKFNRSNSEKILKELSQV